MKISINTKAVRFYRFNLPLNGEQLLITEQIMEVGSGFIPMTELEALNAINNGVPFATDAGEHIHALSVIH